MQSEPPVVVDTTLEPPVPEENAHGLAVTGSLHPLSLIFEIAHLIRTNLLPTVFASFSAASGGVIGAVIGFTIFGGAILVAVFRYLTFRYTITDSNLLIDQGLVFRKHRSVPIERIQNIDSVQNLFHRWLRVAEVRIETASGNEPEAVMRVISVAEVERLRAGLSGPRKSAEVSAPHANIDSSSEASVPITTPTEQLVLSIPTKRLVMAGLISNRGWVLASVVSGYLWQSVFREPDWAQAGKESTRSWIRDSIRLEDGARWYWSLGGGLKAVAIAIAALVVIVLVLRLFSALWYVLKFYDYRLSLRGNDLIISCGLFTKVSATVPRSRIQVISVQRSWLARKFQLAAVRVETLGGSGKEDEDASTTVARRWFIPILAAAELPGVLSQLRPELEWVSTDTPWQPLSRFAFTRMLRLPLVVSAGTLLVGIFIMVAAHWIVGSILTTLAVLAAMAVVFISYRKAKSRRYARTATGFIYRSGALTQKTSFGFWDRVQGIDLIQSPFDRRWQMASLRLDTAGAGSADHELLIEYLDAELAQREYRMALAWL